MPKRTPYGFQIEDTPVSRRRVNATCCWPECRRPSATENAPLCLAHLMTASRALDEHNRSALPTIYTPPPPPVIVRPAPAEPKLGVVYYLRSGGYIKIGWASDLAKRMRAYPPDSLLLATHPGSRKDEHREHKRFAVHRTHGREWYAMVPPLMQHIDRVKAEHGEPDTVAFAARPVETPRPHSLKPKPKPRQSFVRRVG